MPRVSPTEAVPIEKSIDTTRIPSNQEASIPRQNEPVVEKVPKRRKSQAPPMTEASDFYSSHPLSHNTLDTRAVEPPPQQQHHPSTTMEPIFSATRFSPSDATQLLTHFFSSMKQDEQEQVEFSQSHSMASLHIEKERLRVEIQQWQTESEHRMRVFQQQESRQAEELEFLESSLNKKLEMKEQKQNARFNIEIKQLELMTKQLENKNMEAKTLLLKQLQQCDFDLQDTIELMKFITRKA